MSINDDDDDLAEINTTPEQFEQYMREGEPATLIDAPVLMPVYIGDAVSGDVRIEGNRVMQDLRQGEGFRIREGSFCGSITA